MTAFIIHANPSRWERFANLVAVLAITLASLALAVMILVSAGRTIGVIGHPAVQRVVVVCTKATPTAALSCVSEPIATKKP